MSGSASTWRVDAQALNALQKTSGLETVVRKCNEWGFERLLRVQLTGSGAA